MSLCSLDGQMKNDGLAGWSCIPTRNCLSVVSGPWTSNFTSTGSALLLFLSAVWRHCVPWWRWLPDDDPCLERLGRVGSGSVTDLWICWSDAVTVNTPSLTFRLVRRCQIMFVSFSFNSSAFECTPHQCALRSWWPVDAVHWCCFDVIWCKLLWMILLIGLHWTSTYAGWPPKKGKPQSFFPYLCQILTDFQTFSLVHAVKHLLPNIPPHLNCVATLPCCEI